MLDKEELKEKLEDFLQSLEGDWLIGDFCDAYNELTKKNKWEMGIKEKKIK